MKNENEIAKRKHRFISCKRFVYMHQRNKFKVRNPIFRSTHPAIALKCENLKCGLGFVCRFSCDSAKQRSNVWGLRLKDNNDMISFYILYFITYSGILIMMELEACRHLNMDILNDNNALCSQILSEC